MKKIIALTSILCSFLLAAHSQPPANAQPPARPQGSYQPHAPDLSHIPDLRNKLKALSGYCDSLKAANTGGPATFVLNNSLLKAALQGLSLVPPGDPLDSARFLAYIAHAYVHQPEAKVDSIVYYYHRCYDVATAAHSAYFIAYASESLIHIGFEMREGDSIENYKKTLLSILDTTTDKMILRDGYATMGSYYQQKAYYSTAQDYYLKSITIRKQQLDTLHDPKSKMDYATQCYLLAQLYMNTDLTDKALDILYEGDRFKGISGLVDVRFTSTFINAFCRLGHIDSALYYLHHIIDTLEARFRSKHYIPDEVIMPNLSVAQYYMGINQFDRALPFISKADTLTQNKQQDEAFLVYQVQRLKGKYNLQTGHPATAIPLLLQSLPIAAQFSPENHADILKDLALSYKGTGNTAASLSYYDQYVRSLDSLTKEKISRTFADQETRYQTSKKEERIVSLDKDNRLKILELENDRRTRLLLVVGLIALGGFAILLFFIYRNKEKLNIQLNETNRQLTLANDTKARLFGIISHDLRAPVSRIVQLLQIQKEKPELLDAPARQRHEERLTVASENVLETMEDLLLWSKSQMHNFTPDFTSVNLLAVVQKEINLLQDQLDNLAIKVEVQVPGSLTHRTDENFLSVIVRNLLHNAVKYTDPNTSILIAVDSAKPSLLFSNHSSNSDAAALNDRLQNTLVDSKGSGLGLQIAADLAARIDARLFFRKEQNTVLTAVLIWA